MKLDNGKNRTTGNPLTLQDVNDRLAADPALTSNRKRDLRSALKSYAKLRDETLGCLPLDLATIRETLDSMVAAQALVSRKRWANLRSDLGAAIEASGLRPMLRTANVVPDAMWQRLLEPSVDQKIRYGLSRFSRWATLRGIAPADVDNVVLQNFIAELEAMTLARRIETQRRAVATAWNKLGQIWPQMGLRALVIPATAVVPSRIDWSQLRASFRADVDRHLAWCAVPDPLDDNARRRALAPRTLHLRRNHIHSAVHAAHAAGLDVTPWQSLANLVEPDVFRATLRRMWEESGRTLTAYTHGVASTLVAVAAEWVKPSAEDIAKLKALRHKLGGLRSGLTEKNRALIRQFDDPRLVQQLMELPDLLWKRAKRDLETSRRPFLDLQSALAIDILLHVPLRMENLSALSFEKHLHWPQGSKKPALIAFKENETKNRTTLEFELPETLSHRLQTYRNDVAPKVTGRRPTDVFVTWTGTSRAQATVTDAIERAVLRNLGIEITPHQFRHLAAKIILDRNPGAYELVRQLLGQKNMKTTTNYYAGLDTRRAGRAHAELLERLRHGKPPGARQ